MKRIDIREVQDHLERHVDEMAPGETITLCQRGTPVAEMRRLPTPRSKPRPFGLDRGRFTVPDSFF